MGNITTLTPAQEDLLRYIVADPGLTMPSSETARAAALERRGLVRREHASMTDDTDSAFSEVLWYPTDTGIRRVSR